MAAAGILAGVLCGVVAACAALVAGFGPLTVFLVYGAAGAAGMLGTLIGAALRAARADRGAPVARGFAVETSGAAPTGR